MEWVLVCWSWTDEQRHQRLLTGTIKQHQNNITLGFHRSGVFICLPVNSLSVQYAKIPDWLISSQGFLFCNSSIIFLACTFWSLFATLSKPLRQKIATIIIAKIPNIINISISFVWLCGSPTGEKRAKPVRLPHNILSVPAGKIATIHKVNSTGILDWINPPVR